MTAKSRFIKIGPTGKQLARRNSNWVAVYDPLHDLTWSRTIGDRAVAWSKAIEAASGIELLGHTDWLLPTRAQLLTLVDDTRVRPAIDVAFFPNCRAAWYWTRTPFASSPSDYAWFVFFGGGFSGWGYQYGECFVRAVRPGQ